MVEELFGWSLCVIDVVIVDICGCCDCVIHGGVVVIFSMIGRLPMYCHC